jgi:hypothetical protein
VWGLGFAKDGMLTAFATGKKRRGEGDDRLVGVPRNKFCFILDTAQNIHYRPLL